MTAETAKPGAENETEDTAMGTDFFDDDLVKAGGEKKEGEAPRPEAPPHPATESGASRLLRQKEGVTENVAGAAQELEKLRMRQAQLEKEKNALEELARKQDEYERGKRDIQEKLRQSMVVLEKEQERAERMVELLSTTRDRFKDAINELDAIDEESWADEAFPSELNKAMIRVEDAKTVYKKSQAKIEAMNMKGSPSESVAAMPERTGGVWEEKPFSFWVKTGLALTLPLIAAIVLAVVAYILIAFGWM